MVKLDHIGDVSPALLAQMAPSERMLVGIDTVRYRDPTVKVDRVKLTFPNPTGGWPSNLWRYFETLEGPGSATISSGAVGEVRIMTLPPGQSMVLHQAGLLAHEAGMGFRILVMAVYQLPGQQNPSYMEGVELTGPGSFAFQTLGNALSFDLKAGEWIRCAPHALLGITPGVPLRVNVFGGSPNFPPNHYFALADVGGPGTVLVHSGEFLIAGPVQE